jgi:hypothetical protein
LWRKRGARLCGSWTRFNLDLDLRLAVLKAIIGISQEEAIEIMGEMDFY